jgi:hypothetical protein
MKLFYISLVSFFLSIHSFSQTTINFEELILPNESWWVGANGTEDGFICNDVFFPTYYDTAFGGYWGNGFAYSNMTDSVTSGYLNMYSSKAGSGHLSSNNYAVNYDDGYFLPGPSNSQFNFQMQEVYLSNNTFAFNSMRDGDNFTKKFGGVSGNDPDFFSVTFDGFLNGQSVGTPIVFYLADFRFEDNTLDYIVRDWTRVDLTDLGTVDSVAFHFESSDIGDFGINTPLYFCMDDLKINAVPNAILDFESNNFTIFPNPASDFIQFKASQNAISKIDLYTLTGQFIRSYSNANETILLSDLPVGMYLIKFRNLNSSYSRKFVIER